MTFLNPAVLFGLFAAAIPVLLHLFNLRKLKTIEFSTLSFLKELQKNKIRKIKLKQWILMALRVLIILFVVASFARPALQGVSIGGATSSAKTTAVFIVDNTFSMSVVDENGSYFNRARQVVKTLLNELQEGDEVVLIPVADSKSEGIQPTTNLAEFRKQIDQLDISFKSGTLNSAIVKASEVLAGSRNFNKEIYLLSDFQKSRLSEPGEEFSDLSELLNEKVKLYTFNFSGKEVFNLGINSLEANNQIFEKDKPVSFTAEVRNFSHQAVNNTVASLFINGTRSAQQSFSLMPGETKKVSFETILKSSGYMDISASLEEDDIPQDNTRFLNISIPDKISAIIFSDNENDARFLELALSGSEDGKSSIQITKRNLNQLSSVNLSSYDVTVIIGSENAGNTGRLTEYLESGGRVFLMPGSQSTLGGFKNLASKLSIPQPVSAQGTQNSVQAPAVFDKVEFEHPVFANIFEKNAKKQVESPQIYYYFRINNQGKGRNIITMLDNSPFLSEYNAGKGKIIVMSSAPVLSWGNLPLKGVFVPMVNKTVYYLAFKDSRTDSYIAGDNAEVNIGGSTFPQLKVVKPDNVEEVINLNNESTRNFISFNATGKAGNYRVFSGDNRLIDYFSVNTLQAESDAETMSAGDFSDYLSEIKFKGKEFALNTDENYTKEIQQARFGSELWRHFLILAFLLAVAEMLVARSAKKESIQ